LYGHLTILMSPLWICFLVGVAAATRDPFNKKHWKEQRSQQEKMDFIQKKITFIMNVLVRSGLRITMIELDAVQDAELNKTGKASSAEGFVQLQRKRQSEVDPAEFEAELDEDERDAEGDHEAEGDPAEFEEEFEEEVEEAERDADEFEEEVDEVERDAEGSEFEDEVEEAERDVVVTTTAEPADNSDCPNNSEAVGEGCYYVSERKLSLRRARRSSGLKLSRLIYPEDRESVQNYLLDNGLASAYRVRML